MPKAALPKDVTETPESRDTKRIALFLSRGQLANLSTCHNIARSFGSVNIIKQKETLVKKTITYKEILMKLVPHFSGIKIQTVIQFPRFMLVPECGLFTLQSKEMNLNQKNQKRYEEFGSSDSVAGSAAAEEPSSFIWTVLLWSWGGVRVMKTLLTLTLFAGLNDRKIFSF